MGKHTNFNGRLHNCGATAGVALALNLCERAGREVHMSNIGKAIGISVISSICGGAAWLALEPQARRFIGLETPPVEQTAPATVAPEPEPVRATPSFDCDRAEAAIERLICSDEWLAEADQMMSARWGALLGRDLLNEDVTAAQRAWIEQRNACVLEDQAQACVRRAYRDRIAELDVLAAAPATPETP